MIVTDASVSAQPWASVPASAAGAVAPAWGPVWQWIGMPASIAAQATSRLSFAKVMGDTTVVACTVQKGRLANRPSPPASASSRGMSFATCAPRVMLVAMCFFVPAAQA